MAVEAVLVLVTVAALAALIASHEFVGKEAAMLVAGPLSLLCMWHVFAVPIIVMYLAGNPVVMTLSPLVPSVESRAFVRRLRERPALSDDDFYARYYEESGISKDIPVRLRRCLRLKIDPLLERAGPALPR